MMAITEPGPTAIDSVNPYETPRTHSARVFAHYPDQPTEAKLVRKGLLYREIYLRAPLRGVLIYNAMQLSDELRFDGQVVWRRYPFLWLYNFMQTELRTQHGTVRLSVKITFGRFARIRGFKVMVDDMLVYEDEAPAKPRTWRAETREAQEASAARDAL